RRRYPRLNSTLLPAVPHKNAQNEDKFRIRTLEGFTSFSTAPLKVWTYVGAASATLTFIYLFYIIIRTVVFGNPVPGYASLFVAVTFFGSVQLISIGLLGEYIGRIYMEAKQRPLYLIRKSYSGDGGARLNITNKETAARNDIVK
ncbi:hypothetical protein SAMN02746095_03956, partial [Acidocella aminolytica 101 = DSM 11237]